MKTFIELYFENKASLVSFEDFIVAWHASNSPQELHEYLGLTQDEYFSWLKNPDTLEGILENKR